jgi:hypothetical protein
LPYFSLIYSSIDDRCAANILTPNKKDNGRSHPTLFRHHHTHTQQWFDDAKRPLLPRATAIHNLPYFAARPMLTAAVDPPIDSPMLESRKASISDSESNRSLV